MSQRLHTTSTVSAHTCISTHHDKIDEGHGISIDPQEVHATKHVQDDHTDNQHEDSSSPQVETKHQEGHKEHSS